MHYVAWDTVLNSPIGKRSMHSLESSAAHISHIMKTSVPPLTCSKFNINNANCTIGHLNLLEKVLNNNSGYVSVDKKLLAPKWPAYFAISAVVCFSQVLTPVQSVSVSHSGLIARNAA